MSEERIRETEFFERPRFADRAEAGRQLAGALELYAGGSTIVLGIPRGGVPVAAEVARALGAELDVVVARKLRAPGFSELAIGAVTANGGQYLNEEVLQSIGVSADYLRDEVAYQTNDARRREERFRGSRPPRALESRTAIVVDDGLATGATMRAAVRSVRRHNPALLIAAIPVGASQSCDALRPEVDELVSLYELEDFYAVGLHYDNFESVSDETVERILTASHALTSHAPTAVAGSPTETRPA